MNLNEDVGPDRGFGSWILGFEMEKKNITERT